MNKYKKALMNMSYRKMNLQLFADEGGSGDGSSSGTGQQGATDPDAGDPGGGDNGSSDGSQTGADDGNNNSSGQQEPEKKYTQADLDKAIKDAKKEVEKLSKMNADQKRQYEMEKLQKENAEKQAEIDRLKKEALKVGLSREASRILQEEHSITATQDMLDFVVADDAEATKKNIDKLVGIIEADRKAVETARATGRTPKNYTNNGNTMSEIDKRIAKYQ